MLTREAIHRVLGPVDDEFAAELVATGAQEGELQEAWAWVSSDEALLKEQHPFPAGNVATLVEILQSWQETDEEA
ncbi:hypothetical protein [Aquibaculum arenosum]|uniref:Fe-S assembly protein IscX n=1 Tax=Aquibaculum arenosum TaxID=3032591 RepID=A0ABT5YJY4_9PROT|nr:hypothetical protein [Fodinicurvata sp. CAU 1616]MDF2095255.1 hypothetical protein [Fodinicurvata sp. CAU 1616]